MLYEVITDEGLVVGKTDRLTSPAFVEQATDPSRIEIAGLAQAVAAHQVGHVIQRLAIDEEAAMVRRPVRLLGAATVV